MDQKKRRLNGRLNEIDSSLSMCNAISQNLLVDSDGKLLLTEEEKRTLTSEGYAIPTKLPLTKAEERALKKIRRKIKNKISAQESRRKKKEYIEMLEKKLKDIQDENSQLRSRLHLTETANRNLAEQLCKTQGSLRPNIMKVNGLKTSTTSLSENSNNSMANKMIAFQTCALDCE